MHRPVSQPTNQCGPYVSTKQCSVFQTSITNTTRMSIYHLPLTCFDSPIGNDSTRVCKQTRKQVNSSWQQFVLSPYGRHFNQRTNLLSPPLLDMLVASSCVHTHTYIESWAMWYDPQHQLVTPVGMWLHHHNSYHSLLTRTCMKELWNFVHTYMYKELCTYKISWVVFLENARPIRLPDFKIRTCDLDSSMKILLVHCVLESEWECVPAKHTCNDHEPIM